MASFLCAKLMRTLRCVAVLLPVSACAPQRKPAESPVALVRAYARALGDSQAAAAYALMSPDYRQRVAYAKWQKEFDANPQEVTDAEQRLSHARKSPKDGLMREADGTVIPLVTHDGYWYMAAHEIEFYDQSSPRAALHSFIGALTRQRYDVVLRLTPQAEKEGVTNDSMEESFGYKARVELERMLSQLRAHAEAPIEIMDDRATMPYADHKRVQFVREAGLWRIEAPE